MAQVGGKPPQIMPSGVRAAPLRGVFRGRVVGGQWVGVKNGPEGLRPLATHHFGATLLDLASCGPVPTGA